MEKESLEKLDNQNKINFQVKQVENLDELDYIRSVGDSEIVETGDCRFLESNDYATIYSYGANPCISGAFQTKDDKIYLFHSQGDFLTDEQREILTNSKKGIVGGSKETLSDLSSILKESNLKTIPSPGEDYDFNIVFVKDKNLEEKSGLYFCYESSKDLKV